jgi:hypothetical protein
MVVGVEGVIQALAGWSDDVVRPYLLVAGAGTNLEDCQSLAARVACTGFASTLPGRRRDRSGLLRGRRLGPTHPWAVIVGLGTIKVGAYMLASRPVLAQAVRGSDLAEPIAGVTYRVYRVQDRPYIFTVGDLYAQSIPVPLYSDPDRTVITDTVHSTCYRVTALDGKGQESLSSNTVGVFAYLLTPGN